ncbi:hypothetical protein EG347_03335 [Chryseobacterium sp. G0186]|uniref:hypothetical protein n=1 Tax=Chryseobacterium sp. G0186 TaxID=2487064 RepID=UPI000F4D345C|nr:hypothetical protein [Chryseobacterium sp. G0186]AZA76618.1 hypothetical protein EG347_03335 [Chryseobacterium sp. G0186]
MKKLLITGLLLYATAAWSQVKYDTYSLDYWTKQKDFKIEVSGANHMLEKVWIESSSLDSTSKEGYIIVDGKKVEDFISFMNFAKSKYDEWSKTAKDNKVEELSKSIEPENKITTSTAFSYGKWQFAYGVRLNPKFILDKKGANLVISTGQLQSSSNKFIKNDGLVLVFSSSKEIQDFIDKFNIQKMIDVLNKKDQKEDLFK